ncbi:hypothetical protein, conserved [Eimeria acervulina]|uniref:Uncharacterized protein n=1 Tax=Eimeria acervulina TaxID=5801 RepID=U6GM17_EIMAC|nr:hypothetical protein, conserved [Eimeria acervulina]CDI80597.1 hypothetical protein, conserved [Eimeria acervulina]
MGYNANACSRSRRTADGRRTFASFFHNFYLVAKHWFKRSYMAKWTGNDCDSWTSSESGSTLEVGETEIREKDYGLQPYQAPWPTRHEHARFWIRVAPRLVEQLVTSSLLVKRYGVAEKQLLPVHLANAAFRDLEALVVQHIGAVEERDTRRRSRRQSSKKSLQEDKQTLEQWLQELRAPPAAGGANDSLTPPDKSLNESLALKDNHRGSKNTGEEGTFVFEQQRKGTQESLWSVDSAAAAAAESAAAATPQALAFRHLERAAHLSKQFGHVKLEDLQHLKRITKALEWTVAEVFEKMSAIRAAAAEESIWQDSAAPPAETQKLLRDFALHLNKRKRQMALLEPIKQKILLKLLAVRFLTDTPQQREKREKEKRKQVAQLFGEESSILFFAPQT